MLEAVGTGTQLEVEDGFVVVETPGVLVGPAQV